MVRKKQFIHNLIAVTFVFLFTFILFGCKNVKGDLGEFIDKYSESLVYENIQLLTKDEAGNKITWSSSDENIISSNGEIKLDLTQNGGLSTSGEIKKVTLTASVTSKSETQEFSFEVYVGTKEAYAFYLTYQNILNEYSNKILSGYDTNITDEGNPVYNYKFISNNNYQISYSNTNHITFKEDHITCEVIRPTKEECLKGKDYIVEELNVRIVDPINNLSINNVFPIRISYDSSKFTTLLNLREIMASTGFKDRVDTYVFKGYVTLVYDSHDAYQGFYLQDGSSSIFVYSCPMNDDINVVQEGDQVLVKATVRNYNGLAETDKVSDVKILKSAQENITAFNSLEVIEINKENFNENYLKGKDSSLASIDTLVFESGTMVKGISAILNFIFPDMITPITVRIDKYNSDFNAFLEVINNLSFGDKVEISKCAIYWNNAPQISLTNIEYLNIKDETITNRELLTYDLNKKTFGPNESYNSNQTTKLQAKTSNNGSITWSLELDPNTGYNEQEDPLVTLNGETLELSLGEFYTPFEFKLKAIISYGEGIDEISEEVEFNVQAISPIYSLENAISLLDSGSYIQGSLVDFYVADIINGVYYITDGVNYVTATLEEGLSLEENTCVKGCLVDFIKENGIYTSKISLVPIVERAYYIQGELKDLDEIDNVVQKVQLRDVTIQNGKANLGDIEVLFFDKDSITPYKDGKYTNLVGYTMPLDVATIKFIVLEKIYSIKEAVSLPSKELINDIYVDTNLSIVGKVIGLSSKTTLLVSDKEGNSLKVALDDYNGSIRIGDYIYASGKVGNNYEIFELTDSNLLKIVNPNDLFTSADLLSNIKNDNIITLTNDTNKDNFIITKNHKYNQVPQGETNYTYYGYNVLYKVTGLIKVVNGYIGLSICDDIFTLRSYDAFNETELLNKEFYNELIERHVITKDDENKYLESENIDTVLVTLLVVDNFYIDDDNIVLEGYIIPGTIIIENIDIVEE